MACEVRTLVKLPKSNGYYAGLADRSLRRLRPSASRQTLSLAFIGDQVMRQLNKRYRGKPETTDVLSFEGGPGDLGEILVCVPQARRQAASVGSTLTGELDLLVIHGLLHLLGYDHRQPAERRRMERQERRLLAGASLIGRAHQT